jgi:hypothetical protein
MSLDASNILTYSVISFLDSRKNINTSDKKPWYFLLWLRGLHDELDNNGRRWMIPMKLPCFYSMWSGPKIIHKEMLYEIARGLSPQQGRINYGGMEDVGWHN